MLLTLQNAHIGGKMAGSIFRYDLPTKAQCVNLLMNTKLNITTAALHYNVTEITIRTWVYNYLESYEEYSRLNPGVMSVSKTLISSVINVTKAKSLLKTHAKERERLNTKIGERFYSERSTLIPEVLEIITGYTD